MADRIVSETQICLTEREWGSIEGCCMALHAALRHGLEDEGEELVKSVYARFSQLLASIRRRLDSEAS